ncbi:MAG: molybdopterin-dependent oxidoreductase, partial [Gammaproteobacteria bacterium]|nr:molybdopterin-dependent oxidoreductase [Gammaproteobacteria bacterium]
DRRDFSDQDNDPIYPWLGCDIAAIEAQDAIFVVGSNMRREAPILAHRLRKASLAGARISLASSQAHEYFFDADVYLSGAGLVELLTGVAVAAAGANLPASIADVCDGVTPTAEQAKIAASLSDAEDALVLLGNIAGRHQAFAVVRALAATIAAATGARFGSLSSGANAAGAHLAGLLPHRALGGRRRSKPGTSAGSMLDSSLEALVLVNIEPDADLRAVEDAIGKLKQQKFVIALTPFESEALHEVADLLLPIGTFAETSGTYVNVAGTWQSFVGVANPVGESRPAWKVLRVIGNLLGATGFDYVTSTDVRDEITGQLGEVTPDNRYSGEQKLAKPNGEDLPSAEIDVPIYSVDALVRRAEALQLTSEARRARGEDDS